MRSADDTRGRWSRARSANRSYLGRPTCIYTGMELLPRGPIAVDADASERRSYVSASRILHGKNVAIIGTEHHVINPKSRDWCNEYFFTSSEDLGQMIEEFGGSVTYGPTDLRTTHIAISGYGVEHVKATKECSVIFMNLFTLLGYLQLPTPETCPSHLLNGANCFLTGHSYEFSCVDAHSKQQKILLNFRCVQGLVRSYGGVIEGFVNNHEEKSNYTHLDIVGDRHSNPSRNRTSKAPEVSLDWVVVELKKGHRSHVRLR